jgi:formiminotetrahydrofolate cyclodeaminase
MAERARDVLVRCVDEDANAFDAYLDARRLPKDTPEERVVREAALQQSLAVTVDVPWRVAVACVEVMKAASIALCHGNPVAITDAMQGVAMGFAGVQGGVWSVTANLGAVTDVAFRQEMKQRCAQLLAEAERLMDEARHNGGQALERMVGRKQ